jgi:HEPN domain-containing protein
VNRTDLQQLAELRLEDARVLFQSGRYAAAYYLCGYAVERALKACIARQIRQYEYPPTANYSQRLFTHKLVALVELAEMIESLDSQKTSVAGFARNWLIATKWSEESRYENWTEQQARELFDAVSEKDAGVLAWISGYW